MNYFSIGIVNIIVGLSILIFPFICIVEVVEASPTGKVSREVTKKSVSCPGGIRLICPTSKERFVVHYSYSRSRRRCELGSVLDTALKKCDNSIMQYCMDGWVSQNDNCSASIFKKVVDSLFRGACSLHDLCYLSLNTKRDECDDWFLHNMMQICKEKSFLKRVGCELVAKAAYRAVRLLGVFFMIRSGRKITAFPKIRRNLKAQEVPRVYPEVGYLKLGYLEVGDLEWRT